MRKNSAFFSRVTLGHMGLILAMLLLILDSATASDAVGEGILVCLRTVIPSLFPLMVLARLMMHTDLPQQAGKIIGPIMRPLFGQPPQTAICLILGLVGGYPVGAQTVAAMYKGGALTRAQAERLLTFCNNAGPAFVFGMTGALLGGFPVAAVLYIIHILSAVLSGMILKPRSKSRNTAPSRQVYSAKKDDPILLSSIKSMAMICACIVLFQMIVAFVEKYLGDFMPQVLKVAVSGILELSGGCLHLVTLESSGWQYCMASGFLGFGGLCVWMQTKSVIGQAGLRGEYYFTGKLLQSAIAVLLTWGVLTFLPGLLPCHTTTLYLPNHEGLLRTTLWVFGIFFLIIGIWCLVLRKNAGKEAEYGV